MTPENKMLGFIKSNQLINIDRNGISATMIECMDKMLQIPQIEIKKSKEDNIPVEKLLNNRYKISVELILGKHTRGNLPYIKEQVETISKMDIKCIDKNYKSSYTYYVPTMIGKIPALQPRFMPEQYNTTLEYENIIRVVNDKELYDNIEISEYVEVDYYESENGEHRKIIYPKGD